MSAAIEFARGVETTRWVNLRVIVHNATARTLYRSLGFEEVGTQFDRLRIEGQRIDDVIMALPL
jgi:RimJ/RimL family protein N-acetyltransferase